MRSLAAYFDPYLAGGHPDPDGKTMFRLSNSDRRRCAEIELWHILKMGRGHPDGSPVTGAMTAGLSADAWIGPTGTRSPSFYTLHTARVGRPSDGPSVPGPDLYIRIEQDGSLLLGRQDPSGHLRLLPFSLETEDPERLAHLFGKNGCVSAGEPGRAAALADAMTWVDSMPGLKPVLLDAWRSVILPASPDRTFLPWWNTMVLFTLGEKKAMELLLSLLCDLIQERVGTEELSHPFVILPGRRVPRHGTILPPDLDANFSDAAPACTPRGLSIAPLSNARHRTRVNNQKARKALASLFHRIIDDPAFPVPPERQVILTRDASREKDERVMARGSTASPLLSQTSAHVLLPLLALAQDLLDRHLPAFRDALSPRDGRRQISS